MKRQVFGMLVAATGLVAMTAGAGVAVAQTSSTKTITSDAPPPPPPGSTTVITTEQPAPPPPPAPPAVGMTCNVNGHTYKLPRPSAIGGPCIAETGEPGRVIEP